MDQHIHYLSGIHDDNNLVFYKTDGPDPDLSSQDAARFWYDYEATEAHKNKGGPHENHIYRSYFNASTYKVHGLKEYVDAKMSVFDSADCSYAPPIAFVSDIATVQDTGSFSEWRNVWQDRRHLDIFLEPGPALPGHPQALGVSMRGCEELGTIYKKVTKN